jgi:DNA-binding MarR family transcriptional regulator
MSLKVVKSKVKSNKPSSPTNDYDFQLWVLLRQVRDAMAKARERELGIIDISSVQGSILTSIKVIADKATPIEISRRLIREPHSISGLLERMEKQGLVKLVKDLPRRNMVRVVMTKKGEATYKHISNRAVMREIIASLNKQEKKKLWDILLKLRGVSLKLADVTHEVPLPEFSIEDPQLI